MSKKHLIIKGEQASGKTMLGEFLESKTDNLFVHEDWHKDIIVEWSKKRIGRPVLATHVFITNTDISYNDVDPEIFLIIELKRFI